MMLKDLDAQQPHWESTFLQRVEMFGEEPSQPAQVAVKLFGKEGKTIVLELGAGQGRDTLFFGMSGFSITAVDYSQVAVDTIAHVGIPPLDKHIVVLVGLFPTLAPPKLL